MRLTLYLLAFVGMVFVAVDANAQDGDRGRTLHDNHCLSCHDSRVYTRATRAARDYQQVRAQVDRWQKNVSLKWEQADIDLVAVYIATRFYGYECPDKC